MNTIKKYLSQIRNGQIKLFVGSPKETEAISYIIRFYPGEGLMSMLYKALGHIEYAEKMRYIPYIDCKFFKNQYSVEGGYWWEEFFSQPIVDISTDKHKRHKIIVSSYYPDFSKLCVNDTLFSDYWAYSFERYKEKGEFFHNHLKFNESILEEVNRENFSIDVSQCVGVLLRGTDYTSLKPKGHPAQPDIDEVCRDIHKLIDGTEYNIFLVTEDMEIEKKIRTEFADKVMTVSDNITVNNYMEGKLLFKSIDDPLLVAKVYLKKIILLSRCKSLIAGRTNGSLMAAIINGGAYSITKFYDKGMY